MSESAVPPTCIFCVRAHALAGDATAFAIPDEFPVAAGHTLVVLTRHESSLLRTTPEEWQEVWALVRAEAARISKTPAIDGVNIGVNIGAAAGQTVDHAHIHVIPRTIGDSPDPRGGVRRILDDGTLYNG